jgi:hypothetical protein
MQPAVMLFTLVVLSAIQGMDDSPFGRVVGIARGLLMLGLGVAAGYERAAARMRRGR